MIFTKKNKLTENDEKKNVHTVLPKFSHCFFFFCSTVSVTLICEKTQPPFPELSQQVGPTSTNKGFSQSHVVRHKECELCQLMTSQSMFGSAKVTRFAKTFICRTGPKHVFKPIKRCFLKNKKQDFKGSFLRHLNVLRKRSRLKTPGCPSLILADKTSVVLLYATVQSQVDNSCTFLRESGC